MTSGTDIRDCAHKCVDLFGDCVSNPVLGRLNWVERGQADFNLWVHGLNATSTGKASLDYRVREREDVLCVIRDLLSVLAESLQDGLDQISTTQYTSSDATNFESSTVFETFEDLAFDIKTVLKQLSRIHIAIRRAGSKLRHQKADASLENALNTEEFKDWKEDMENLILMGIENQNLAFPTLTGHKDKTLTSVQERLIYTNLLRRHRIQYATKTLREAQRQAAKRQLEEAKRQELLAEKQAPEPTASRTDGALGETASKYEKDHVKVPHLSRPSTAVVETEVASKNGL